MKHDAIIFDIDGTLWDVRDPLAEAWNIGLAKAGIKARVSAQEIGSVLGNPTDVCIDLLLPGVKLLAPGLKDIVEESELETIASRGAEFYPGAVEGVKELAGLYKIFIVSNCHVSYLRLFLEKSGLEPVIAGFDCYGMSGSPKGRMLAEMKKKSSLENPIYVGDTVIDERAAAEAGMDFAHVSYGFGSAKASLTFDSFPALADYFIKEAFNN